MKESAGLTGMKKISDNSFALELEYKAHELYTQYMAEELTRTQDVEVAHQAAKDRLKEQFKPPYAGALLKDLPIAKQLKRTESAQSIKETKDVIAYTKDKDFEVYRSEVIPGTEESMKELQAYARTGRGSIPPIYGIMSARTNGKYSKWEIAEMQLQASGEGTLLPKPSVEVALNELPADTRRLLNWRPTNARTFRAMYGGNNYLVAGPPVSGGALAGNWKAFLDLVASVESKSYGDYDAYNLRGSNNGFTAHGSGNSAIDNRYGKPLSQLTVNEVLSLGAAGNIHAAGRYQFVHNTLKETVEDAGLTGNEIFNAETQDLLAVTRARWRLKHDRGMSGLRREWIGLNYVGDAVLRPAMLGIMDDRSPYNQPENLSPRVRDTVYSN